MNNINIHHLKVIREIHKQNSMTEAAKNLFLTQSALSHHLKDLENNIGVKVFERRNKKLFITDAGRKMLSSAEIIIEELNNLEKNIDSIKNGNSGLIKISTECYTTYNWLPSIVKNFNQIYPDASIQIVPEATLKALHFLEKGLLDIAITSRTNVDNPLFKIDKLFCDELVVLVHKENPLAKQKSIVLKDFCEQVLLVYDMDEKEVAILEEILKPAGIVPKQIIKMPYSEVIIEMVKANYGIAVMARWIASSFNNTDVKLIKLDTKLAKRTWNLISYGQENVLHRKFIEFMVLNLKNKS